MNIHEYQAKGLFAKYGIPVPQGYLALTPQEAGEAAGKLEAPWVVKAQVHAGGRGKAGGVKVCKTVEEVEAAAKAIIGMKLVTKQTGEAGKIVHKVWVESGTNIARELYLAVVLDRTAGRLACMASPDGGMDIETVAAETPDHIFTCKLDAAHEIWPFQARKLFFGCGLDAKQVGEGVKMLQGLVKLAKEEDAVLVEINPLCVNAEGHLVALDAQVNFDDAALKRHPAIAALDDPEEADPLELKAKEAGVNYVHLGGEVGTMVNGAGLAMATMDAIKQAGSTPANFLDAGGGANEILEHGGRRLLPHARGSQRQGRPHQHLRRHPALRHRRPGRCQRGQAHRHDAPARHPHGRHQRGGGAPHPQGKRPQLPSRGLHVRSRPQNR